MVRERVVILPQPLQPEGPGLAVSLGQRFDEFPAAPVLAMALEHRCSQVGYG